MQIKCKSMYASYWCPYFILTWDLGPNLCFFFNIIIVVNNDISYSNLSIINPNFSFLLMLIFDVECHFDNYHQNEGFLILSICFRVHINKLNCSKRYYYNKFCNFCVSKRGLLFLRIKTRSGVK